MRWTRCVLTSYVPHSRTWTALVVLTALVLGPALEPAAAETTPPSLARISSIQNQVEAKAPQETTWAPSTLDQALYERSRVRTGAASRAAILYSDQSLQRIVEKSELEILAPGAGKPGLINLLLGTHYFSSRTPKEFSRIETPTVTAAIRGTEFVVQVDADATTRITMLEGVVEASNPLGTLTVQSGEQAFVEPGKAPVKRIVVRPRDAVAWALYYPAVLGGSDAERLKNLGAEGQDLTRAAQLLSAGQVDAARPLIGAALDKHPADATALALASVIEVTTRDKARALRLAEDAVRADPQSAAAALALSFAAQAAFDIPRARSLAEKAAELDPQSSVALARASELRMAEGDLHGAQVAAEAALARSSGEPRALAVLGFARLAQFQTVQAEQLFERSVAADSSFSLARLGLGLARIRGGRVDEGREEIQMAVVLDPDDSLLRSYLGKAYYEEKRSVEAGKELAAAKALDASDPTPYLYDAIRLQNENRPAEALDDLRESIARNDRRAVYRSRLLLDEDRAVRGSDLARIYNDLGFSQLGMVAARRSADEDQSNYSGHLFLAGTYRNVPNFSPALFSEILQARIYQPVSVNAARPDIVNETVSFNEYTALFDRPRARAFGSIASGRTDTDLTQLSPSDPSLAQAIMLDHSDSTDGEVTGTINGDHYAAALGFSRFETDGFRKNNDQDDTNFRGFFEWSPTYRDSFQVNALVGRQKTGDLPLRFVPAAQSDERFDTHLDNFGLGYHHVFSPGSDFALSIIRNKTEQTVEDPTLGFESTGTLEGPQGEVQQVFRLARATWVLGTGAFRGEAKSGSPLFPSSVKADDRFTNAYGYLNLRLLTSVQLTLGASYEDVVAPTGLQAPRDTFMFPAEIEFSKSRVSPKLAVSYYPTRSTVLRAAFYERLAPAIGRIQTLEPTQVAGFNQFFFEPGGTRSRSRGVGVDQEFGSRVFGGVSLLWRNLDIPEAFCSAPDPFGGCAFSQVDVVVQRESRDVDRAAYLNAVLSKRLAFAIDYSFERRDFDFTLLNNNSKFEDRIETHRWRPQLRWFLPGGWFAWVAGNYFDQAVRQRDTYDPAAGAPPTVDRAKFWTVDASVGYKLPRRYGSIVVEGRNIGDREFDFFERAIEDTVIPAREITLALKLTL